jgi:hypothetical protein
MRRIAFAVLLAATVVGVSLAVAAQGGDGGGGHGDVRTASADPASTSTTSSTTTATTLPVPNADGALRLVRTATSHRRAWSRPGGGRSSPRT